MRNTLIEALFLGAELIAFVLAISFFLLFSKPFVRFDNLVKNNGEKENSVYMVPEPEHSEEVRDIVSGIDMFYEILDADPDLYIYLNGICLNTQYVGENPLLEEARLGDAEKLHDRIPSVERNAVSPVSTVKVPLGF